MRARTVRIIVGSLAACLLPGLAASVATQPGALLVEPSRVPVGLFFSGAMVRVSARIPDGYEAAVRLSSGVERLDLKQKGRVGGVLWMSVGDVVYLEAPVLYQLLTTAPLDTLAPAAVLDEWKLGYATVIVSADEIAAGMYPELVKLKERGGLYVNRAGGLRVSRDGDGVRVDGEFALPASVRPGDYVVDVIGFSAGHASRLGSATVVVERVGSVRAMWTLAMEHGLFYGSAAVIFALVAGLLTGLLFQSKRHGGH